MRPVPSWSALALSAACALLAACSSSEGSNQPGPGGGPSDASPDSVAPDADDGSTSEGCVPKSCLQVGAGCGQVEDGCGALLECGTCTAPDTCGGAGVENQCGCTVKSCSQLGVNCGDVDTGCGPVSCGSCTSPETCGGSGVLNQCGCVCTLPNASTICIGGACQIDSCEDGWANCDGDAANGCETDIGDSLEDCGACGKGCSFPNATGSTCENGKCVMGACADGFADCDADAATGCEANLGANPTHCGTCGNACPAAGGTPVCVFGQCAVSTCSPGLGDCSPTVPGCETNLLTSTTHCGYCGNACSFSQATAKCDAGTCVLSACNDGYGNCDQNDLNGCETNTNSNVLHCGTCSIKCKPGVNATTSCVGGKCLNTCVSPWVDCDTDLNCETNAATDPLNCGGCGLACSSNHVPVRVCSFGACTGNCEAGWADCNNNLRTDGCETEINNNLSNCGGCGLTCSTNHIASPLCKKGSCAGSCASGWGDCNFDKRFDGCETNLNTSQLHCGACNNPCGDCQMCSNGVCVGVACR
jgi:hypothetical protein